jgi:hypothetical protein
MNHIALVYTRIIIHGRIVRQLLKDIKPVWFVSNCSTLYKLVVRIE